MLAAAIVAPSLTAGKDLIAVAKRPWDPDNIVSTILICYSAGVFLLLATTVPLLAYTAPRTLNWCLRFLVCFFNVTYPFTSIFGLFWIGIPIYVAFAGTFPFNLNAQAAAIGSLILKVVEFCAVAKLQGTHLDESAISITQKMDKVAVPIKLRAIMKGFITGYNDRYHMHDNSWWVSFGASATLLWIRRWLLFLMASMSITFLASIIHLGIAAATSTSMLLQKAMPLLYGALAAMNYVWLLIEPFKYLMKGEGVLGLAPRWAEVVITIMMTIGIFLLLEASRSNIGA